MHYKEVTSSPMPNNVINKEELLERVDRDYELLRELFLIFTKDLPIQLQDIENAIKQGDCGQLKISAHRLKGSLGNLAAHEAYNLATKIEIAAGQCEIEIVRHVYPDLVRQTHFVTNTLESIVNNGQF